MAIEKNIKINVDAKDAIKDVKSLDKSVNDTSKSAADSKSSFGKMTTGVQGLGLAFKALGIGLIVAAFVKLQDALSQNQAFADKVNIALETVNITFQQIIGTVVEKGQKVIDFFQKTGSAITKFFKKDIDDLNESVEENNEQNETAIQRNRRLAKEIVELRKQVRLQEAEQRKLQLTYQKDAELQRQIRDNTSLTIDERIEANNKLANILNKQLEDEKFIANEKIRLAELELSKNKDNVDLQIALTNAQADLAEVEERITSQRSENKINETALEQEFVDAQKQGIITLKNTQTEKLTITDDTNSQMLLGAQKTQDELNNIEEKGAEGRIKIERHLNNARRDIVAGTMGDIASLVGEESKAGKALAVGQALINTYSAATAALAPPPVGAGPIFGTIAAVGAVAAGMANVKKIIATKLPGADGGGSAGSEPDIPQLTEGLGALTPNLEGIEQPTLGGTQPAQAYVIESDISNAQALQEELNVQATL
jgi:hypothetical protein